MLVMDCKHEPGAATLVAELMRQRHGLLEGLLL